MITASKVTDVEYYVSSVGGGRESYYLDAVTAGEPPGRWSGSLAEQVGLTGEVAGADMHKLFDGFEAPDGTQLGQRPGRYGSVEARLDSWKADHPDALPEEIAETRRSIESSQRRATLGVDLTFSVPKSVSVVHTAVHRAELQAERSGETTRLDSARSTRLAIEAAIAKANDAGLRYAAKLAVARTGRHGGTGTAGRWVGAPDLIVASFFQHTSRSIQPQLHTHNVILNRASCADGEIRALDTVDLFAQQHAISAVVDRVLAEELAALGLRLKLRHGDREKPAWEIAGVSQQVCDLFSARTKVIKGELDKAVKTAEERLGRELTDVEIARLHKQITVNTRPGKTHDGEMTEERHDRWQAELKAAIATGLEPIADQAIAAVTAEPPSESREAPRWSPSAVCTTAVAAMAEQRSTWRRADLTREIEQRLPLLGTGMDPDDLTELLERLTDQALTDPRLVTQVSGRDGPPMPAELGDPDTYTRPTARRYAATASLAAEEAIRQAAITRGRHRLDAAQVDAWLDTHEKYQTVGADQRAAVRGLASSDAALAVLVGPAGTGKSFAVGALAEVWNDLSEGGRVQGLAVSQIAADVLVHDGVKITANISAWLDAQRRLANGKARPTDHRYAVRERDIVLVDEASMVGTADLTRIRTVIEAAGARLVLTGDPRQLAAVQAGGAMGLVNGHAETYTLTDVRRFHAAWEREASLALRDADPAALAEYDRHGRIIDAASVDDAIQQAARAAAADRLEGREVVVVAGTNEESAEVAATVREILVAAGVVDQAGVDLATHGGTAGVGDDIMCRQNDRRLGVTNRQLYQVREIGEDGSLTVAGRRTGEILRLSAAYVREHVASGYAGTVHAAEGLTVDAGYGVTAGQLDAAALYVMMTRGKTINKVFVALDREPADPSTPQAVRRLAGQDDKAAVVEASADHERPSGRAVLEDALARGGEDNDAALVTRERDDARLASLDTIHGRIEDAVRLACRNRLEHHLDQLVEDGALDNTSRARLCADQATENLSRLLRAVEQGGEDPAAVLREAVVDRRGLGDARSVAQVLSNRINAARPQFLPPNAMPVPSELSPQISAYLQRLHARADQRRSELGTQVSENPPDWAVRALGPVPEGAAERLEWADRAGIIAGHREATGWTDEHRPIGDPPGIHSTERRPSWWRAWEALGRPEEAREEAAMTDGRLRVRVEAWKREQAWAPPHADDALRAASIGAEDARIAAILTNTDNEKNEQQAHHEQRAAIARVAEQAADARAAWAAETAATRAAAARAEAELEARGIPLDREPDRTTAEEWLAAQRAADHAEDPYRPITEPDLHNPERDATLAEGVETRAGDLAMLEPPPLKSVAGGAHEVMSADPDQLEVELGTQRSAAALERIAARASRNQPADKLHDANTPDRLEVERYELDPDGQHHEEQKRQTEWVHESVAD
ncbi:MobF family relaxase [Actinopolymorpha alba]|uniref:MobF family relaxase n=1 Tax=Actinopolymorpha alba TaxID=533267 RepID=UPI00035CF9B8|nr:MobF family relaxase [Actinopolymorpha alba]